MGREWNRRDKCTMSLKVINIEQDRQIKKGEKYPLNKQVTKYGNILCTASSKVYDGQGLIKGYLDSQQQRENFLVGVHLEMGCLYEMNLRQSILSP